MAVAQGVPEAMNNLAFLYDNGLGVPQDSEQAVKYDSLAFTSGRNTTQQRRMTYGTFW
jgi:TPR repeat protein